MADICVIYLFALPPAAESYNMTLTPFDKVLTLFGKRVKEERKKRNITQEQFAVYANVSVDTIKRIESGKGTRLDVAYNIAEVLNLPLQSLLPKQDMSENKIIEIIKILQDNLYLLEKLYKK